MGPAIASGNQVWSGNWPDLPMQAMNSATAAMLSTFLLPNSPPADASLMWRMSSEPKIPSSIAVPTSRPTSPTRTVRNALSAERALASSSHQCPISMNEQRPMISQPRISITMFGASAMMSIPDENRVSAAKKCVYRRSPRTYSVE